MDFPHALPERVIRTCGPPGLSINTNDAGIRAKEVYLTMLSLYRRNERCNCTLVSDIKGVSLSTDFSPDGRDRIGVEIGNNDSSSTLCDKARGECFANTAGSTRYNTDFASDLHT
jgi:hypothetical protein